MARVKGDAQAELPGGEAAEPADHGLWRSRTFVHRDSPRGVAGAEPLAVGDYRRAACDSPKFQAVLEAGGPSSRVVSATSRAHGSLGRAPGGSHRRCGLSHREPGELAPRLSSSTGISSLPRSAVLGAGPRRCPDWSLCRSQSSGRGCAAGL